MNEFIIWDKLSTRFGFGKVLQVKLNGNLYVEFKDENGKEFYKYRTPKDIEILNYIGLDSVSGQKIYADSSIVEFDFLGFGELIPDIYTVFIKWNREKFRYDIQTLSRVDKNGDLYIFDLGKCIDRISNIKIIDTIQENKLGLIK